ncbi:MAG TPA: CDP-archaeol synthase [Longimicrobium sp.]|nr:CDP-archaeol synthase [Longimicrobium sp.]
MREFWGVVYLIAPLLVGAVLSGLAIRYDLVPALRRPIDGGRTWRGRPLFGPNKTWRGVLTVCVGNAIGVGLQCTVLHDVPALRAIELFDYGAVNGWLLGLLIGLLTALAELPNSFMKRQSGVVAGGPGSGVSGAFFYVLDQVDVLIGLWLAYALVMRVTPERVLLSFLILFFGHQLVTVVGYGLGMRRTIR